MISDRGNISRMDMKILWYMYMYCKQKIYDLASCLYVDVLGYIIIISIQLPCYWTQANDRHVLD